MGRGLCACVCVYLYFVAALGRPPVHQSQDVQPHVVLTAPPQGEPEACGTPFQVDAVEPGLILTQRQTRGGTSALRRHTELILLQLMENKH